MPGKSTPNPSDPDPSREGDGSDPRRRLKLKRIGPYAGKPDERISSSSSPATPPPPSAPEPDPFVPPPAPSTDVADTVSLNPRRRLRQGARILIFVLLLVLILLLLALFLWPSSPSDSSTGTDAAFPERKEALPASSGQVPSPPDSIRTVIAAGNPEPRTQAGTDLEAFLTRFTGLDLAVSSRPRGLFAGPVFIPEGTFINRELGLVLTRVEADSGNTSITVTTKSGTERSFPLSSTR